MKAIRIFVVRRAAVVAVVILVTSTLGVSLLRADSDLKNPVNPNAPTPNAGVAPGHRAAGDFTARRPGNLPAYRPQTQHSYTGVTKDTP